VKSRFIELRFNKTWCKHVFSNNYGNVRNNN